MAKHPQDNESGSLLRILKENGLKPIKVNNGEYVTLPKTEKEFIEEMPAADECLLTVEWKTGRKANLFLVYGNNPGELICDYGIPTDTPEMAAAMDKTAEAHAAEYGM